MAENELIVVSQLNALDLFTGDAMDPLIAQARAFIDKHVPDVSTVKGRGDIASLARKVASFKVVLDDMGKDLVSDWKEKAKKVDIVRKKVRDELDALRDYAREPLTRWEQAEAARLHQEEMARQWDAAWDEAHAMHDLFERERIVREKEAEIARQEAERKAKEQAERLVREQKDREERIAREAEERVKRQVTEAAERVQREAAAALQREKDRADRAEHEKVEAEARAKREQEEAVRRAEQRASEEAERKERERLAAERTEKDRQEKLAANRRHRSKIEQEAIDSAINAELDACSEWIAAISAGKIKHVMINY